MVVSYLSATCNTQVLYAIRHAVINLDHTIAVTQNFVSRTNLVDAWAKTRIGRKRMATKWLDELRRSHPDLAARIDALKLPPLSSRKNKRRRKMQDGQ